MLHQNQVVLRARTQHSFVLIVAFLSLSFFISCKNKTKTTPAGTDTTNTTVVTPEPDNRQFSDTGIVTVAFIRPSADGKSVRVYFNERQQVFNLAKDDKSFEESNRLFEAALKSGDPVRIITNPVRANFSAVAAPSAKELEDFRASRRELIKAAAPERVELDKIDTSKFNRIEEYLVKWPVFRLCAKVVPDYATAKQIFDYCKQQGCNLPGPYAVNPCIPFQYVIDGCYARAHKMRWIIEQHFGYCSEKVFSFALGNDDLAVKANKWGGCCVFWWYHVAPLIRVKFKLGNHNFTLAYVIDPSMFDQPVLLHTWLKAQENKTCANNAKVTMYSIQPSSAYTPGYPAGTNFSTDPNYAATNATLTAYKNKKTCP